MWWQWQWRREERKDGRCWQKTGKATTLENRLRENSTCDRTPAPSKKRPNERPASSYHPDPLLSPLPFFSLPHIARTIPLNKNLPPFIPIAGDVLHGVYAVLHTAQHSATSCPASSAHSQSEFQLSPGIGAVEADPTSTNDQVPARQKSVSWGFSSLELLRATTREVPQTGSFAHFTLSLPPASGTNVVPVHGTHSIPIPFTFPSLPPLIASFTHHLLQGDLDAQTFCFCLCTGGGRSGTIVADSVLKRTRTRKA